MKKNIQIIFSFCLVLFLQYGCKKQELAEANPPKVVNLIIKGATLTDTLQFVKDGKPIGEATAEKGDFNVNILVKNATAEVQIRRKGHTEVLDTRIISATESQQNIDYYFDGEKIYSKVVSLKIKGYSGPNLMEFVVDGKVVASASGGVFPTLNIGVNKDKKQVLQIRKAGETAVLMSKDILADVAAQTLAFFYNGTIILDKIDVVAPSNPANTSFIASFQSSLSAFDGPVDLVFYKGSTGSFFKFKPADIRIELPADGTFSKNIELPPLPDTDKPIKNTYVVKLVKRGTLNELPYNLTNVALPITPESGFLPQKLSFVAGGIVVFAMGDLTLHDDDDGTTFRATARDIASYFK